MINKVGLDLIKKYESCSLKPYWCPSQKLTVGWGHVILQEDNIRFHDEITQECADELLQNDLKRFEDAIDRLVKVSLNENQRSALVSFCFNIGDGAFAKSTLLRKLNQGDYLGVPMEMTRWVKGTRNGVKIILPGLVKRRSDEGELFSMK